MKIRKSFVSNSSSSSFICEVCGLTETGFDASPSDFDMVECINLHLICDEHRLNEDEIEHDEESDCEYDSYYGGSQIPESACPICQFEVYSQPEMVEYLKKTRGVSSEVVFEEIKKMNKRRKKLYNHEYIQYVSKEFKLTEDSILQELKTKFGTYDKYKKFLREK